MAETRSQLWLTTSRIRIINVVTFLMLNAIAVADKGNSTRQCYWCGPIAEQVHRSEVAPPCGTENTVVFTCQEGHNYCAIAASSPPYVESRFCSKVYQDECYPQYCNSTKKWRMTCTCRGDLCNENITKRESDAFSKLPRQVEAKESREKRNTKNANLVLADEKTVIITNLSAIQNDNITDSDDDNDDLATKLTMNDPKLSVQIISKDEELVSTASTQTESIEDQSDEDDSGNHSDKTIVGHQNELMETSIKDVLLSKVTVGTTKMTKAKDTPTNTASPSEKLPTAEALQQEASSENDETNTEHTTVDIEPTEAGTSDIGNEDGSDENNVTAEPKDSGESSSNKNTIHTLLLANGLLLQFIYSRK